MLARRDTGVKEGVAWDDVAARVPELLEQIQVKARIACPVCRLLKKIKTCVNCNMCTRVPELLEQIQVKATLASAVCCLVKKKATCVQEFLSF